MDISRNDLCTLDQVPSWQATYPVGGRVVIPDVKTGVDIVYIVLSATVDNLPTYHPGTNLANYRCSALLRPFS
jgi:hypothetical protein